MEYRKLGNSGMYVSEISFGNWITHGSQVEQEAAIKCVRTALDCGITTLDTADVYAATKAETVLGKAGLSRKHIMESVHASLKRLNTDHIDLYQFHRFDYETPLEESLSAFDDLIRQGKVMYIGFSEWRAEEISAALKIQKELGYNRFVSSQPQYSALWRVIESEVDPLCRKEGIGQIVWSPMAQGVLTGKYLPGAKPPAGSRAADKKGGANMISRWLQDDLLKAVQKLKPIAEKEGLTMGQLAIAWVLQNENVSSAIIGATKPAQIKDNVKASGVKLSPETLKAIDAALNGFIERDAEKTVSPKPRA